MDLISFIENVKTLINIDDSLKINEAINGFTVFKILKQIDEFEHLQKYWFRNFETVIVFTKNMKSGEFHIFLCGIGDVDEY